MSHLKTAGKVLALAVLSFLLALLAADTPVARSYALAVLVSVALCPALLGFAGSRLLGLGPAATLAGVNALPLLSALDDSLRLGDAVQFRWLAAAVLFTWAGWRLGKNGTMRP